jgi:hypothetical protein
MRRGGPPGWVRHCCDPFGIDALSGRDRRCRLRLNLRLLRCDPSGIGPGADVARDRVSHRGHDARANASGHGGRPVVSSLDPDGWFHTIPTGACLILAGLRDRPRSCGPSAAWAIGHERRHRIGLGSRPHADGRARVSTLAAALEIGYRSSMSAPPDHALQRTRRERRGCNPRASGGFPMEPWVGMEAAWKKLPCSLRPFRARGRRGAYPRVALRLPWAFSLPPLWGS